MFKLYKLYLRLVSKAALQAIQERMFKLYKLYLRLVSKAALQAMASSSSSIQTTVII
jgi:hypothetical protein